MTISKRILLLLIGISIIIVPGMSQKPTKEFKKLFMAGYGDMQYGNYAKAVKSFLQIETLGHINSNVSFNIGLCYLNIPGDKSRAIPYLERAIEKVSDKYREGSYKETLAPPEAVFYLAKAYRINMMLPKSIEFYQKYKEYLDPGDVFYHDYVELQVQTCKNAMEMIKSPVPVKKTNMGALINNGDDNFNPVITPDGNIMIYTTLQRIIDRVNQQETYYEIINYTIKDSSGWTEPLDITSKINSDGYLTTVGISQGGGQMYFFRDDYGDGNLYMAEKKGYRFTSVELLDKTINSKDWESHIYPTASGESYYFSSTRQGGKGGRDIYYVEKDTKGRWKTPENLGKTINTLYDEDCPVISADGNTLYFCSEAHSSMGGYDVFYSIKNEAGEWSTPLNMGYPINSTDDDVFFMPYESGKYALMALRDEDSYGGQDIYKIQLKFDDGEDVPEIAAPILADDSSPSEPIAGIADSQIENSNISNNEGDASGTSGNISETGGIDRANANSIDAVGDENGEQETTNRYEQFDIRGLVLLQDSNEITSAFKVAVKNTLTQSLSGSTFLTSDGQFSISVPPGDYIVSFSGPGYESLQRSVNIPADYGLPKITIDVELIPKPVTQGEYVLMRGVLFDNNNAQLTRDAKIKLEKLNVVMKQNPHLYAEISGYSAPSEKTVDQQLSEQRAANVIKYLEDNGVERNRFVAKAMGDEKLLVSKANTNPEAQRYNRRVEINIIKTGNTKIVYQEFQIPESLRQGSKGGVMEYTILLVDSNKPLQPSHFIEVERHGVANVWIFPSAQGYLYTIGKYSSRADAAQLLNRAVDMGFPNASIINFKELEKQKDRGVVANRKRIELADQQGGQYTIQLLALKVPVETSYFKNIEGVERKKGDDGFYRYIWGRFDYKTALQKKQELVQSGQVGAFIMNLNFFN